MKYTSFIMVAATKRHKKRRRLAESFVIFVLLCGIANVQAPTLQRPLVSVLDFGTTPIAKLAAETIRIASHRAASPVVSRCLIEPRCRKRHRLPQARRT